MAMGIGHRRTSGWATAEAGKHLAEASKEALGRSEQVGAWEALGNGQRKTGGLGGSVDNRWT